MTGAVMTLHPAIPLALLFGVLILVGVARAWTWIVALRHHGRHHAQRGRATLAAGRGWGGTPRVDAA